DLARFTSEWGQRASKDNIVPLGSANRGRRARIRRRAAACRTRRRSRITGSQGRESDRPLTQTPAASVYVGRALSRALATAIIAARGCCAVVLTPPGDSSRHPLLSSNLRGRACTLQHPGCAG